MGFSSIFEHSNERSDRLEPEIVASPAANSDTSAQADSLPWEEAMPFDSGGDPFDFLGQRESGAAPPSNPGERAAFASVNPDDLIGTLYARYCEALASPNTTHSDRDSGRFAPVASAAEARAYAPETNPFAELPISALFAEPQCLEQAIGALDSSSEFLLAMPDIARGSASAPPDVLQLFAPPEHHARLAACNSAPPPALARREHHTLAIDSPITLFHAAESSMEPSRMDEEHAP